MRAVDNGDIELPAEFVQFGFAQIREGRANDGDDVDLTQQAVLTQPGDDLCGNNPAREAGGAFRLFVGAFYGNEGIDRLHAVMMQRRACRRLWPARGFVSNVSAAPERP